jgi:hypothetical protein
VGVCGGCGAKAIIASVTAKRMISVSSSGVNCVVIIVDAINDMFGYGTKVNGGNGGGNG